MENNNQLMNAVSNKVERFLTTTQMCSEQPNSDYIDFENGNSLSIYDIKSYRNEYDNIETEQDFETYLVEQVALYIENKRYLPN